MQTFQILYLRQNVLEQSETVEVDDILEAIDHALARTPQLTAEIWTEKGKVAVLGASLAKRDESP